MPKVLKAGRGFIVKHAGDWFRVPKKLLDDAGGLTAKQLDDIAAKQAAKDAARKAAGKKARKASKRDLFMGKTPGRNSDIGQTVQARMRANGDIRDIDGVPSFQDADGSWLPVDKADMGHRTSAVDFWNHGSPPEYPTPGKDAGPRSPYVREFMDDPDNYELQGPSTNRSEGAGMDGYDDPS